MEFDAEDKKYNDMSRPHLIEYVKILLQTIFDLRHRVQELENRLNLNSSNSSIPPSKDPLNKKVKKDRNSREKTGKLPGGQPGHPGKTLLPKNEPDDVIDYKPEICSHCSSILSANNQELVEERQEVEIPVVQAQYIAHRIFSCTCPRCNSLNKGEFPSHILQKIQYGPRLTAFVAYLAAYQLIPVKRLTETLTDLLGCPISQGTVINMTQRVSSNLDEFMETVKNLLINSPVIHNDETGAKKGKEKRWLHVACTPLLTLYGVFSSRGKEAIDTLGILPNYLGVVVHDFWGPYINYLCKHAYCNAHIIRELTRVDDETGQQWAVKLRSLLVAAKKIAELYHKDDLLVPADLLKKLRQSYLQLIAEGFADNPPPPLPEKKSRGRIKQSTALNLLDRLSMYQDDILRFLYDPLVPFDNNQAERDIRMAKLKMKISGAFRSNRGADTFCRLRSYISTMKKQNVSIIDGLIVASMGKPWLPGQIITYETIETQDVFDVQKGYA